MRHTADETMRTLAERYPHHDHLIDYAIDEYVDSYPDIPRDHWDLPTFSVADIKAIVAIINRNDRATTTDTYGITYTADHEQRRADYNTDRAHGAMTRETITRQETNR